MSGAEIPNLLLDGSGDASQPAPPSDAMKTSSSGIPKRKNRASLRKRPAADGNDGDADDSGAHPRLVQRAREAPLAFTTKRDEKTEAFAYTSSEVIQLRDDGGATRQLETETQRDARAGCLREQGAKQTNEAGPANEEGAVYRGMAGYTDYRAGFRGENATGSGPSQKGSHGPLRPSTHVRMSIRVDYQPDVCKDYKETGYCGFGDACKFLHDRGDYKAGWELDRDWEAQQKAQRERIEAAMSSSDRGSEEEDDDIPFACLICRRPWAEVQDPVVTRCRHYFCEQCALQHNAKSKKCFACDQPTGGIFNVAADIIKREKKRRPE